MITHGSDGIGNKTRVVLKARFISEEDKRKHRGLLCTDGDSGPRA